ncbi:DUF7504 family protein [Natrarchaeobius oligotrophus]|uniref:KaiC-like domain-containing protein n=1 Tax=Natrarchaeobius chitinivorans TaxID=1679083 RepID=A0A3N6MIQ6_NATCH|nr:hypothetical protein [Natrarchaeobius chitinivorans]RQH03128.1 hypothetical protein EA472_00580 [Natrarchaeobius chitinivorans]
MESKSGNMGVERATFAQTLDTLKREGSNLLLVGSGTADAHTAACHRLCGESAGASRYRVVVTEDASQRAHNDCPASEPTVTIEFPVDDRTTEGETSGDERTSLGRLGLEIIETIDEFDTDAGGLEPSELRVCVDSLVSLLQNYDTEEVFRLLHVTTSRIDQSRGMGHYHLAVSRDHEAVSLLEPMFDAVVELRTRDGVHEQQWHLRDRDAKTDWVHL